MENFTVFGIVVLVALVIGWVALVRTGFSKGPVPDEVLRGLGIPDDADARALIRRWRDRARRWRTLGGLPLATATFGLSLAIRGEVWIGLAGAPLWSDPLLMGLMGAFVGALGAEVHHLHRRPRGPRTVSLAPRDLDAYLPRQFRIRLASVLAVAGAAVLLHLFMPAAEGVPLPGLLGCMTGATVVAVQRAIVTRPRPALPAALTAADDAARGLAIRSLDAAGAGAVLLLALWQLSAVTGSMMGDAEPGLVVLLTAALYLGFTIIALVWWWRGGPTNLMTTAAEPHAHGGVVT